jgi:cell division protein FtsZ
MIEAGLGGVSFIAMNTDTQVLDISLAARKLQLGGNLTRGLGAGGNPEVGRSAAEESKSDIRAELDGADMVFITAGMGGGTGTGAAPVIAEIAQMLGALTVAVVTKPFSFEGPRRMRTAEEGIEALKNKVDTVIVVPNDRLLTVGPRGITLVEAFRVADDVLRQGVQGISDIVTIPGLINVDFADVRATMQNAGRALMGIGTASGDHRAETAARDAIASPLLETSIDGATKVLINITSGPDLTLAEAHEAAGLVTSVCDQRDASIIVGWVMDNSMEGKLRVTVLAAGFSSHGSHAGMSASAHAAGQRNPMLDVPPALRPPNLRTVADEEPIEPPRTPGNSDDLEIPPFLRSN